MGRRIHDKKNDEDEEEQLMQRPKQRKEEEMTLLQIFHRISKIPVFMYLVAQGLFGASESISIQMRCVHFNMSLLSTLSSLYLLISCTQQKFPGT